MPLIVLVWVVRRWLQIVLAEASVGGGFFQRPAKQLHLSSGGPKDVAMLYTLDLLRADFAADARELTGLECETVLDEGPGHQGLAHVVRVVWQKC